MLNLPLSAAQTTIQITVPSGVAGQYHVPIEVRWKPPGAGAKAAGVRLWQARETTAGSSAQPTLLAVQFEPDAPGSAQGELWLLLPPSSARERRFELRAAEPAGAPSLAIKPGDRPDTYDVFEGSLPVLRYNHGTVPAPPGIGTNYARGDYIMPLYGPTGEVLTDDYPKDHPHHRALGWSWPVTRWKEEVRDIWAVVGVWARPVAMRRSEAGPVFALLEAESVWKWGDTTPIVRELVRIRAFRQVAGSRLLDIEVTLTGLEEGVAIGGRPHGGYGGFGLRAQPAEQRVITRFTDPPGPPPRRSWVDYSGRFAGGQGPAGLAIFEQVSNPLYPNEIKEYPELNYVMPAFPGEREVPLKPGQPLVLRHRVWIHAGMATPAQLEEIWTAYAQPPRATLRP